MKIMSAYIFKSKGNEVPENVVISEPPEGYKKITQIYVEPQTGVLVVVKED